MQRSSSTLNRSGCQSDLDPSINSSFLLRKNGTVGEEEEEWEVVVEMTTTEGVTVVVAKTIREETDMMAEMDETGVTEETDETGEMEDVLETGSEKVEAVVATEIAEETEEGLNGRAEEVSAEIVEVTVSAVIVEVTVSAVIVTVVTEVLRQILSKSC